MNTNKQIIPIFFACDDKYVAYMSTSLLSIMKNSSKDYEYHINVLSTDISNANKDILMSMQDENFKIFVCDVNEKMQPIKDKLIDNYYFSINMYFRLFIQSMFPQYDKGIYLDCDTIVVGDISKLYNIDLKDNLIGAAPCQIFAAHPTFIEYSKKYTGVDHVSNHINSGVLLLNLKELRKFDLESKFLKIVTKYNIQTITPDQDYINVLCAGRMHILPNGWNKMITFDNLDGDLNLIHYALFQKPWFFEDMFAYSYYEEFLNITPFKDEILLRRKEYLNNYNGDGNDKWLDKFVLNAEELIKNADKSSFIIVKKLMDTEND